MNLRILIIIPAYNEELNIVKVVENLKENYSQYDYVVVNDGSQDSTAEICLERGYPLIDLPVNLGLSGAVQAGMRYAVKMGYDAAIQFDGDGQHQPEFIQDLLKKMMSSDAGIVIGSRFLNIKKSKTLRMLGSRMISFMIRISTGMKITDPTSGMRLFRKDIVKKFAYELNYGPEPDTISYLIKEGIRVEEVQVIMKERTAGESYLNLARSIKYMLLMSFSIVFVQQFRKGLK